MSFRMPEPVARERIAQVARAIIECRVVPASAVPAQWLGLVFVPLALGALAEATKEQCRKIMVFGVHGEHVKSDLCVNGFPVFLECCIWRMRDWHAAVNLAERMRRALDAAEAES